VGALLFLLSASPIAQYQLTTTTALLDFPTPRGLRLNVSSLSSPNYATSYSLGGLGLIDGSLSYLYTSLPLSTTVSPSQTIDLHDLILGYRQIHDLPLLPQAKDSHLHNGRPPTLLYGRLYLPQSTLEALYLRRVTPTQQVRISAVSDSRLRNGGTILATHQYDTGRYATEALYSTDGGLLGVRGIYNFGNDARGRPQLHGHGNGNGNEQSQPHPGGEESNTDPYQPEEKSLLEGRILGRFTAGGEMYYSPLNKSGGLSLGGRFATLHSHRGVPLTATVTVNPLMGNFEASYAVKAGRDLSLASRFEFNAYSYESSLVLGMELWRFRNPHVSVEKPWWKRRSTAAKLAWRVDEPEGEMMSGVGGREGMEKEMGNKETREVAGVLKARIDHRYKIGVLWEGRVKDLVFSLGTEVDLRRKDNGLLRTVGVEVVYAS
jgi:distribution and morphology protein 10